MEKLKHELDLLIERLEYADDFRARLESLVSVYPFNEYEYIISHLLAADKFTLAEYQALRDAYIDRNLYLYINRPPKVAPPGPILEYVKFALSQRGQKIVIDQGYYPLPTTELNRLTMMWTTPVRTVTAAEEPAKVSN